MKLAIAITIAFFILLAIAVFSRPAPRPHVICFAHAVFTYPSGIRVLDENGNPKTCHDPEWRGKGI